MTREKDHEQSASMEEHPDFKVVEAQFASEDFIKKCGQAMDINEFHETISSLPAAKSDYHFTKINIDGLAEKEKDLWLYCEQLTKYIAENMSKAENDKEYLEHLRKIVDIAAEEVKKYMQHLTEAENQTEFYFGGYLNNRLFLASAPLEKLSYMAEQEKRQ